MKYFFGIAVALLLLPATGLAASDYVLKLDGVEGESKPARATVEPTKATVTSPTGGTEAATGYVKIDSVDGEANDDKKTGIINLGDVRTNPAPGIEPDEIDYDDSESTTNFGILLGGSDTSDERKRGLERAAEVIRAHAEESGKPIESLSLNFTKIEYVIKKEAKLFGVIPVHVRATVDIDETETASVSFPWWAFFVSGLDRGAIEKESVTSLSDILKIKRGDIESAIRSTK